MSPNIKSKKIYPPTVGKLECNHEKYTFQFQFQRGDKVVYVTDDVSFGQLETFKIIPQKSAERVQAIRVKQPESSFYEIVDMLPIDIPLEQPLRLYQLKEVDHLVLAFILVGDTLLQIKLPIDHPITQYNWAIEAQLKPQVIFTKQFRQFGIKIDDRNLPKALEGFLSFFVPAKGGYQAILTATFNETLCAIPCHMRESALWDVSVAEVHHSAIIFATVAWNEKYKQYQVTLLESPWAEGTKEMALVGTKTMDRDHGQVSVLKLCSDEKNLQGLVLEVVCRRYDPFIPHFIYDPQYPIYVVVHLEKQHRKTKVIPKHFKIKQEQPLIALVRYIATPTKEDQKCRMKLLNLGNCELEMQCQLYLPSHLEIDHSDWARLPLKFKTHKLGVAYAGDGIDTLPISAEFRAELQPDQQKEYLCFSRSFSSDEIRYRIYRNELYQQGIADVIRGSTIHLTIQKVPRLIQKGMQKSMKKSMKEGIETEESRGSRWEIIEIKNLTAAQRLKEPRTMIARALCQWSAFGYSEMREYDHLLSGYYRVGALLRLPPIEGISLLLPVSARLLREAEYYQLTPATEVEVTVRENSFTQKSPKQNNLKPSQSHSLVCMQVTKKAQADSPDATITAKCLWVPTENDLKTKEKSRFQVETTSAGGPSKNTQLNYNHTKPLALNLTLIPRMKGAMISALTGKFKGKHFISNILNIRIELEKP